MKKRMKKWLGCAAAAIMVIAMGATGFARDFDTDQNLSFFGGSANANVGVHSTGQALGNTVSFDKVILVEEGGTEGVDEPYVSWKYTIRPVKSDGSVDTINAGLNPDVAATYKKGTTTISDGTNTVPVEPGTAAMITGGTEKTAEFKANTYNIPTAVITAPDVQTFTKTVSFSFDTTQFTRPGVYRFVITESEPEGANKTDVEDIGGKGENGAVQQDVPYQRDRFLDVYVRSKDTAGVITYEIYGYVMHSGDTDKDHNATGNKWAQHKNSGFDGGKQKGSGKLTPQGYTRYIPRKVKIKKKISGLVPTDTLFPFTIQLLHGATPQTVATNDNKDMQIKVKFPGFVATAPNTYQIMTIDEFNAAPRNLKHDDEVEIIGLPKSTTVVVKEQNKNFVGAVKSDLTGYKSVDLIDANKDTSITGTNVLQPDPTSTALNSFSTEVSKQLTNNDLGLLYHNHVDEITPTGVVLTVVPYAMMIFVAISMAFMFLTKRKEE